MRPSPRTDRVGAGALLVGVAIMSGIYAPQPLLAEIAREFDRTAFEANLVVSMTTLGIAVGVFPLAALAARFGRGRVIAGGLAAAALLTTATFLVSYWPALVAVRMLAGVAAGAVLVSAIVWVSESVPAVHARRAAAFYVAGTTAGGMLGRVLAGVVADAWGWRAGIAAVDAALVLTGAVGLLLVARNATEANPLRSVASSGVRPIDPRLRTVRVRLYVLGFLGTAVFVGVFNAIAFRMLAPPFSLSLTFTSMLFLTYLAGTLSSIRAGRMLERIGLRATVLAGLAVTAGGLLLTLVESLPTVILGLLAMAAGFFVVHTASSATVPTISARPTRASAWYTLLYYTGSSAGALLFGAAWDTHRWLGVGVVALVLSAVAAVIAATLVLPAPPERGFSPPTPRNQGEPS